MRLKQISTCICMLLVTGAVHFLDNSGRALNAATLALRQEPKPEAKKVAEFSPDEAEYLKVFGEDFARALKAEPNSRGYIIFYRPVHLTRRDTYCRCNEEYAKGYLDGALGIPESRITAVKGGYRHQVWMEYWIVPQGASAPKPTPESLPKKQKKRH